jgi:putative RNA polymerase component gp68
LGLFRNPSTNGDRDDPNAERERLLLASTMAPHEPPAVLRCQRRGYRGQALVDLVRLKPTALQQALDKALGAENEASRRGCEIHDVTWPEGGEWWEGM